MATTIVTKNSTTAASVPSAGSLTQGELAVNVTDKRLFTKDSGGNVVEVGTNPTVLAVTGNTTVGGTLGVTGAFSANGGATLGDASGDALTINSSAVSIPNGLNFDSNTFVIDAANNNVGIGTSSPTQKLDVAGTIRSSSADAGMLAIATTGTASLAAVSNSRYWRWLTSNGDTSFRVVDESAGAERMRIDSSGNVGIGTSSPASQLDVSRTGDATISLTSSGVQRYQLITRSGGRFDFQDQSAGATRWSVDQSGNLLVGTTSLATPGGAPGKMEVKANAGAGFQWASVFNNATTTSASVIGVSITYTGAAPNGTGNEFLYCIDTSAVRATIRSNGGIANYSANNVNISDAREKTNVELAGSYLDKICAIPVKTFNYIDQNRDEDDGLTLGVIAQDVEAVAPELVMESNWGSIEEPKMRLSIYQTDLQYALMKCIQEQQAIITDLKSRIETLESK